MTKEELVANWRNKAEHRFDDAKLLHDNGSADAAVNRLYYAALAAVTAALAREDITAESHKAAVRLVGYHLVKPGRIDPELGRLFRELQLYRDEADYDGTVSIEAAVLTIYLARTRAFLDAVLALT